MGLMCHVVAAYPSEKKCIELLLGMQKAGVKTIEVQIPFSDPIADGETIMLANDQALAQGMTTKKSFELIKTARRQGLNSDIYIMSYAQKLISFGFEEFCRQAKAVGARGLIIPDLPIDATDYDDLREAANKHELEIVPVVSPGVDKSRLHADIESAGKLIYLTSTKGITGKSLNITKALETTAKEIKSRKPHSALAVGFGIATKKDIKEVLQFADIAILGSSVIREIDRHGVKGAINFLAKLG